MSGRIIVTPYNPQNLLNLPIQVHADLITGFNLGPHQFINILCREDKKLILETAFWGFCPTWLDPKDFATTNFSIPQEKLKPSDYTSIAKIVKQGKRTKKLMHIQKPCLVPVSGFFKWQGVIESEDIKKLEQKTQENIKEQKPKKVPYAIRKNLNQIFFLAGIWTNYINELDLSCQKTFALVNAPATKGLDFIESRMPIILDAQQGVKWLETIDLANFTVPNLAMEFYRVATSVGDKANITKDVITPISQRFSTQS